MRSSKRSAGPSIGPSQGPSRPASRSAPSSQDRPPSALRATSPGPGESTPPSEPPRGITASITNPSPVRPPAKAAARSLPPPRGDDAGEDEVADVDGAMSGTASREATSLSMSSRPDASEPSSSRHWIGPSRSTLAAPSTASRRAVSTVWMRAGAGSITPGSRGVPGASPPPSPPPGQVSETPKVATSTPSGSATALNLIRSRTRACRSPPSTVSTNAIGTERPSSSGRTSHSTPSSTARLATGREGAGSGRATDAGRSPVAACEPDGADEAETSASAAARTAARPTRPRTISSAPRRRPAPAARGGRSCR